jgi:hypothetical protein
MQAPNLISARDFQSIQAEGLKIPKQAFVVKTDISTYRFGKANEKGERLVSRDEEPLYFNWCRILRLNLGEEMILECLDSDVKRWYSRPVHSFF